MLREIGFANSIALVTVLFSHRANAGLQTIANKLFA